MQAPPQEVTRLLSALRAGDEGALGALFPLVYAELQEAARRQRRQWPREQTLNTTGLVHEAYLRLVGEGHSWEDRAHFLGVASVVMRHVLIDHARRRKASKRGGGVAMVPLDEGVAISEETAEEVIALEEALQQLEKISPRQGQIVECRFFGGLTIEETAQALGLSEATVKRGWNTARAWLYREMKG